MNEINTFDVLKRMSVENKRIWLAPTITEMNYNAKKGSEVTFGIEGNVLFDIKDGKKQAICLLWSVEEFNAMRAQMQAEPFPAPPEPTAEAETTGGKE